MAQEDIAKKRAEDKEMKLQQFQNRTKANAARKLREDAEAKQKEKNNERLKKMEKQIKAKEYAKIQREHNFKSKNSSRTSAHGSRVTGDQENNSPNTGNTQHHRDIIQQNQIVNIESIHAPGSTKPSKPPTSKPVTIEPKPSNQDIIQELSEENVSMSNASEARQKRETTPANKQTKVLQMYYRVDQEELEKRGLGHKSEFDKDQVPQLQQFSMLQRFRNGKDLKAPDRFKSKLLETDNELREKEEMWWRTNVQTEEQKQEEKKTKTERSRYIQALKVLVKENGQKMNPENGSIPPLCNCGAQMENISKLKSGGDSDALQMCASNCQFYKNEKGYVRALRDVLHSINLFK